MLAIMTLIVIGLVVFAMVREGIFSAVCHLFGVVFAGLVAFHFWPALANMFEESFEGSTLAGYEDALSLFGVYLIVGFLCRLLTNVVADREIEIPIQLNQILAGCVGAVTGYLLAGFLVCVLQTLPWEENFLSYKPPTEPGTITNKVLPPDQIWLKLMNRSASTIFEDDDISPKNRDQFLDFTYKFAKHRRFTPERGPLPFPKPAPVKKEDPKKPDPKDPMDPTNPMNNGDPMNMNMPPNDGTNPPMNNNPMPNPNQNNNNPPE